MSHPSVNINSVPISYFTNGVEAPKPAGEVKGNQPLPPSDDQGPAPLPSDDSSAGALAQKLDVLLLKAATASTQSLDGTTVKTSLQQLVTDGLLDKNTLELLATTADKAASTLKALNSFTGAQLAAAVKLGNVVDIGDASQKTPTQIDTTSKAGKAVKAALDAQFALSNLLMKIDKQFDAIVSHEQELKAKYPDFHGIDPDLVNQVGEFRLLCDRRMTEINRLTFQMYDFSLHLAANGKNADPNISAILKAKVADLLPRQALAMHGTVDALMPVNEEITGKLRPLAARIDAFKKNPTAVLDGDEVFALQSDIRTMKAAIQDIKRNGVAVGDGHVKVAADIIKALETELAKAEKRFETAKKDVAARIRDEMLGVTEKLLALKPDVERELALSCPDLIVKRNDFFKAFRDYVEALNAPDVEPSRIQGRFDDVVRKAGLLKTVNLSGIDKDVLETGAKFIGITRNIDLILNKFEFVNRELFTEDRFLTGKEAISLFEGKLSVSSVVEARARGLPDEDVDPANEDANISHTQKLGSGAAGTVFELTRASDGAKVVFKGETESRTGLAGICAGCGEAYGELQQTVNLNIAAKHAADKLGCGHLIVNYSVGTHQGTFGFYMDKASGFTGADMVDGAVSESLEKGLSRAEISMLPPEQRRRVKANLMRELNRLQWLDLVTGQMDRHCENYFIHVDPTTLNVTVKGIDNDAGFTQLRKGVATFALDDNNTIRFYRLLSELAENIDGNHVNEEYNRLLSDPGILIDPVTQRITVDATQIVNKVILYALKMTTGVQSVSVPDKIDRGMYDALMAMRNDPVKRQAYLDSIRDRLSDESYQVAEARLDDAIDKAELLGRDKSKIVEAGDWINQDEDPLPEGNVVMSCLSGDEVMFDDETSLDIRAIDCPSYFARDGLDELFA